MASSRPNRRSSRMPSPVDVPMKDALSMQDEARAPDEQQTQLGDWSEPALRAPAPSFEDYKGLERHGVLEHMAPLGTLPNQKVKLRLKAHEPARRSTQVKNGEITGTREEVNTPDPTPPIAARRSEPRKVEDRTLKSTSSRERDEDQDYRPKGAPKVTPLKSTAQPSLNGTPNSRPTTAAQGRLKEVVDAAVERSYELGNPVLGLAVKKLFEESLYNRTLADLLGAVLSQKPTPRQAADFQGYIKVARKHIKSEKNLASKSPLNMASLSKSVSQSPSKGARPSVARQSGTQKDLTEATGANKVQDSKTSKPPTSKHHAKLLDGNVTTSKEGRAAKRVKRSKSASSLSSLSSLSSIDQDLAPSTETDQASIHASAQPMTNSIAQPLHTPKLHNFTTTKLLNASSKQLGDASGTALELSAEDQAAKRRKLQKTFEDFTVSDSGIRAPPLPKKQTRLPYSIAPLTLLPSGSQQLRLRNNSNHSGGKDNCENLQSPTSSVPRELQVPPAINVQPSSRGATPTQLGRPPKQVKKAARVKMSPIKKRNGVVAGIARNGGGRDSPIGYVHTNDAEDLENSDNCASCGGGGQLLCCDGCTNSFHFGCLDPPMDSEHPPEGQWYCFICQAKREPKPKQPRGVFADLHEILEKKNPVEFELPRDLRDYFEGVKTGEDGKYEEIVAPKARTRAGYEEAPNNLKLKDGKENAVLCFACSKSSMGHREIVSCDLCSLHWHLDCMDPPLAVPPRRNTTGNSKYNWVCPAHTESKHQALEIPVKSPSATLPSHNTQPSKGTRSGTGRTIKVRRPKNARIIDTALRRGFRNNGLIEIENDPSDEDSGLEEEVSGVIYRVPEKGIKLDFIDQVKRSNIKAWEFHQQQCSQKRAEAGKKLRTAAKIKAQHQAAMKAQKALFDRRSFAERKVALNLAQMGQSNPDLNLGSEPVDKLIGTLIAEAPNDVVALHAKDGLDGATVVPDTTTKRNPSIPPTPPESEQPEGTINEEERQVLLNLQELIRRKLAGAGGASTT